MQSFQFLHAADLHLDTPFEGLSKLDPSLGEQLRDASLLAFDALIDLAVDRKVAFVLFAGDIYDGADRGVRAQLRFRNGLQRLSDAGICSFIIYGNHDPLNGWSAIRAMPPGVTQFSGEQVTSVPVVLGGNTIATIHGISYLTAATRENLALRFGEIAGDGLQIGLLHANVGGSSVHGNYSPCSLQELQNQAIDYWALGHIHKREILQEQKPTVVYPGCLQGRSPKPSDRAEKGAYLVTAMGQQVVNMEFVPLDKARFIGLELDATDLADLPELLNEMERLAAEAIASSEGRTLLATVVITGRTALHHDLQRSGVLPELTAQLREGSPGGEMRFWWDRLVDESAGEIDLAAIRQRGDFLSAVMSTTESLSQNQPELEFWMSQALSALRTGQVARFGDIASDPEKTPSDLLARSMLLAVEMLEPRSGVDS